jgi:large subunit ribosomal protein L4
VRPGPSNMKDTQSMASLTVYNRSRQASGELRHRPQRSIAPRINKQLLHDVVVMYQSNSGWARPRPRAAPKWPVRPRRCIARRGRATPVPARRSGIRRGGGHIVRQAAARLVLIVAAQGRAAWPRGWRWLRRFSDSRSSLIDELKFDAPKTKDMAAILKALNLDGRVLVATAEHDVNVYKSARNIEQVTVSPLSDLNALTILAAPAGADDQGVARSAGSRAAKPGDAGGKKPAVSEIASNR